LAGAWVRKVTVCVEVGGGRQQDAVLSCPCMEVHVLWAALQTRVVAGPGAGDRKECSRSRTQHLSSPPASFATGLSIFRVFI
jgi:hypothetical protein